jgi:hypothetical protein
MPRKPRPYVAPEKELLKSVLALLEHRRLIAIRLNASLTVLKDATGKRRAIRGAPKDWPDVVLVLKKPWRGRFGAIELKRKGERPRPGQYRILRMLAESGAACFWADNIKDVEQALDRLAEGWDVRIDDDGECSLIPPEAQLETRTPQDRPD